MERENCDEPEEHFKNTFKNDLDLSSYIEKNDITHILFLRETKNIVFDGDATAIGNINKQNATEDIYSVSGMNVGKDASRLQRGVYIVNGKKVVKK